MFVLLTYYLPTWGEPQFEDSDAYDTFDEAVASMFTVVYNELFPLIEEKKKKEDEDDWYEEKDNPPTIFLDVSDEDKEWFKKNFVGMFSDDFKAFDIWLTDSKAAAPIREKILKHWKAFTIRISRVE